MWSRWIADSGATAHMTDQREVFSNFLPFSHSQSNLVKGIGGAKLFTKERGNVKMSKIVNGIRGKATTKNVLYVPNPSASLISITAATRTGMTVIFSGEQVHFTRHNEVEMTGDRIDRKLYFLNIEIRQEDQQYKEETANLVDLKTSTIEIWHQRLAHLNYKTILEMSNSDLVDGLSLPKTCHIPEDICHGCAFGKIQRKSFTVGRTSATCVG